MSEQGAFAEAVEAAEDNIRMLGEFLRAVGAKEGSCVLEGFACVVALAREGLAARAEGQTVAHE